MDKNFKEIFKNPGNEYRAKPFWSWNGKLEKDEIKRQVKILKEMGFGGYFMHSRVGLITEYLGDEWFDIINACSEYGDELGMENWLYDEDRWPSGTAGGMVTEKKEYRQKFIRMNKELTDSAFIAFYCRLDGVNVYDIEPYDKDKKTDKDIISFEIIERPLSPEYNGTTYLDTMKKEATEAYIKSTHEKYREKCGDKLGTSIKGIFTDEPHRGELMISKVDHGVDFTYCAPFTDALFDIFREKWGYSLESRLPELFLKKDGEDVSEVKWHYSEVTASLFVENFIKPIQDWCSENGIILTGHLLHEDTLSAGAIMAGSLMRGYEVMEYPGVDVLGKNNHYNIVKQLSSVAHQCGKKTLLSELYGATGWEMGLEDYKNMGDWQALMGINLRCPHLSWYTMMGECKRDYPASIFFQSSWYREYKLLEDYYARIGAFLGEGESSADVLVISPVESMWCSIYAGWGNWLTTTDEKCRELEAKYKNLYRYLLSNNVEFDYGDEEMLSRLAKVEDGVIKFGNATYKKVIVSGMLTMRSTTYNMLKEFEKQGGVVVAEDIPLYIDAKKAEITLGNARMEDIIKDNKATFSDEAVFSTLKKCEDGTFLLAILNTDTEAEKTFKWSIPEGEVAFWNPETGVVSKVEKTSEMKLNAGEMKLFTIGKSVEAEEIKEEALPEIELSDNFAYKLSEPNVLVVDRAKCILSDETFTEDILKIDIRLRDKAEIARRGGAMYQPWYTAKNPVKEYFPFTLEYSFVSDVETEGYLASEYDCALLNGAEVSFTDGWWVDPCFKKGKIKIKKGENTVTVKGIYTEKINLEAIYILGEFGVFDGIIKEMPGKIGFGDITKQGFMLYGGKIKYIFNQSVKEKSLLELKGPGNAAAVTVNGKTIFRKPYSVVLEPCDKIEIELSLKRRNTFGPLHRLPLKTGGGPDGFITTGEHWSDDFVTFPTGLEK